MNHHADARRPACTVTLGLMSGHAHGGRLGGFAPTQTDLDLECPPQRGDARSQRRTYPAESMAYVAIHLPAGVGAAPRAPDAVRMKVVLTGGKSFTVWAPPFRRASGVIGFFAVPDEPSSPFQEIYFYAHAVLSVERCEALGAMLVARGAVSAQTVDRAVEAQKEARAKPIGSILVAAQKVSAEAVIEQVEVQRRRKMRLGEVLIEAGLVSQRDLEDALMEQKKQRGRRLGEILVESGALTELALTATLAEKFLVPLVDLDATPFSIEASRELSTELIERFGVLALESDPQSVTVVFGDPLAVDALDAVLFHCRKRVIEAIAVPSQLKRHVAAFLDAHRVAAPNEEESVEALLAELSRPSKEALDPGEVAQEGAVIRLGNRILLDAFARGASDVHIEPQGTEKPTKIRFRVDGECFEYQKVPGAYGAALVARMKIMANLDIAERRKPQDGKIKLPLPGGRQVEFRLATLPTVNSNEDAVLRVLADGKPMALDKAGFSERNLREIKALMARPYGLLLCVGPTGSGKTSTLHAILGALNTPDTKIWTAEDPVEITQEGLRQVQMHPKIGLTFASALRAFLRADPDVIMVGEMRDEETASIAVEASLTGHLVLSTLHTNSAPETITRLLDMGLNPFTFSDALLGVLAQRLVRALCRECRVAKFMSQEEHAQIANTYGREAFVAEYGAWSAEGLKSWSAPGCPRCKDTGYKGRLALHELLVNDDSIRHAIMKRMGVAEVRSQAIAGGMKTLRQDGIDKALLGVTDFKQALAV